MDGLGHRGGVRMKEGGIQGKVCKAGHRQLLLQQLQVPCMRMYLLSKPSLLLLLRLCCVL